jgi:hypothetical protein
MPKTLPFPQYRKYLNNKGYFKILSEKEWEEIQIIGSKKTINQFTATIFPDKNFLHDLTYNYQTNWVEIEEAEYDSIIKTIKDS